MSLCRYMLMANVFLLGCVFTLPLAAMDDRERVSLWIRADKPIPRGEIEELFLSLHERLTPEERVKGVQLLQDPDRFMLEALYESDYSTTEKADLLGELKDREMEFGVEELIVQVAAELAVIDLDSARQWVGQFSKADYAKGNGLAAVLQVAHDKDKKRSLAMIRELDDDEAEAVIGYADLPQFEMNARAWQTEVNQFRSASLKKFLLDWPIVFLFAKESPRAALDYINSLPPDKRNAQQGRQVVWALLQQKNHSPAEVLEWIEQRLPKEATAEELYGQLATHWANQDAESFRTWFSKLQPGSLRDEVVFGFAGHAKPVDWKETYDLAASILDQKKRQTKVAWVLGVWQLTDPSAAEELLEEADITDEMRIHLKRTFASREKNAQRH